MDDAIVVAGADDLGDGAGDLDGSAFAIMATGDDTVEEFATLAELHDEVDGVGVLESGAEADKVGVGGEDGHDGDLAADVLDVDGGAELALGDGLAGEELAGGAVSAEVGDAELSSAELGAEEVVVGEAGGGVVEREALKYVDRVRGGGGGGGWRILG